MLLFQICNRTANQAGSNVNWKQKCHFYPHLSQTKCWGREGQMAGFENQLWRRGNQQGIHGGEKPLQLDFFSPAFVSKVPENFSLSFPNLLGFTLITEKRDSSFLVVSSCPLFFFNPPFLCFYFHSLSPSFLSHTDLDFKNLYWSSMVIQLCRYSLL